MSLCRSVSSCLFWYETPKVVHIRSRKVGLLGRFLQLCIISYIIGFVMVHKKGYQEFGKVESAVVTKVKGVAFTERSKYTQLPYDYRRIWDVPDLIVPSSENNAFFVTTNIVITANQSRSTCGEDSDIQGALCDPLKNTCIHGQALPIGNGVMTGNCIVSQLNSSLYVCEVEAWCPLEQDILPLGNEVPLLEATADFTVLIKNFVEFPTFGNSYRRRNIMEEANETYLQSCRYHPEKDPYCPVFRIGDIVEFSGENFTHLSVRGGVIVVGIEWNCNLDYDFLQFCKPRYTFRRADDPHTKIAPGWNFRYAHYHEPNRRTLFKAYGIRFIIDVQGTAGKFNVVPTMLNVGSGLALLGLTTVLCDFVILYFTKRRRFYKEVKYLLVDGDDVEEQTLISTATPRTSYDSTASNMSHGNS